jgi:hypothetical protein
MAQNISNDHKIYQHFTFPGPPKYTQIGIFGIKNTIWQHCFKLRIVENAEKFFRPWVKI